VQNIRLQVLAKIALLIFLYILVYYTFFAFNSKPTEGDSLAYHIPIATSILNGSFLNPASYFKHPTMEYSPGSSEAILSLFMIIGLPLNIYNVVGLIILVFVLYQLALQFGLEKNYAIIFAATFCTIHTVVRWLSAQTIDIWLAIFFSLTLILLQKPEKKISYFLKLGFSAGMLIGTKYTGPLFLLVLCLFYFKQLLKSINVQRFIVFLFPFTLVGLFWYIRNYVLTGDPYYPQSIPFFRGKEWHILDWAVWKIIFLYPTGFIRTWNAFVSEYTVWVVSLPFTIFFLISKYKKINTAKYRNIVILICIGLMNFIIYFFLPSGPYDNLMVTGFRYTYPAFIPLILSVFIIAQKYKREEFLSVISLINMIMIAELSYHPKILLLYVPVGLLVYFINVNKQELKI